MPLICFDFIFSLFQIYPLRFFLYPLHPLRSKNRKSIDRLKKDRNHKMLKGQVMVKERAVAKSGAKISLPVYADRVADEAARILATKARWTPPAAMAAAPMAPAAGPKVLVPEYDMATGGLRRRVSAHWRAVDVFDLMEQQALREHARRGGDAALVSPFTPGQVEMGRRYQALVERRSAGGMRCAGLEAGRGGSGGGDFMTAFMAQGDEVDLICARIGQGAAMVVRRIRPSKRGGSAARVITDRALVDGVCLEGQDLNGVLRAAGWSADGHHRKALRTALSAALDRMQGYDARR